MKLAQYVNFIFWKKEENNDIAAGETFCVAPELFHSLVTPASFQEKFVWSPACGRVLNSTPLFNKDVICTIGTIS